MTKIEERKKNEKINPILVGPVVPSILVGSQICPPMGAVSKNQKNKKTVVVVVVVVVVSAAAVVIIVVADPIFLGFKIVGNSAASN